MTTDRATLLATINNSPLILSLLYDLNLLPEQVEAETYKAMIAAMPTGSETK